MDTAPDGDVLDKTRRELERAEQADDETRLQTLQAVFDDLEQGLEDSSPER